MRWYDFYKAEFGKDIITEVDVYRNEFFNRVGKDVTQEEIFQAIRDLKSAHDLTKCFEIRLPGPSDIVRQIKRNRKKGDGGKRYIEWLKARVTELNNDVERFNAIVDPVRFLGASRDSKPEEISSLLTWAKNELGFDKKSARDKIYAENKPLHDELNSGLEDAAGEASMPYA